MSAKEDAVYVKATDFQIHASQNTLQKNCKNIFDYSEYKLKKIIQNCKSQKQQIQYIALLDDYVNGFVSIAWKAGTPIYIKTCTK